MKKLFLLFISVFCSKLHSQDFMWAYRTKNVSTSTLTQIRSIASDNTGNIFAVGAFTGTSDFDDSVITNNLTTSNIYDTSGFLLKLDENKNFIWVKKLNFGDQTTSTSIIFDNDQNIIITGTATGQVIDLNPDPNVDFLINNPSQSTGGYIVKLDYNGNFINGKFYPGTYLYESTIDNSNNIISTGILNGNIVILKNETNLIQIWDKIFQGNHIFPHSIVCDNDNNIILKGNFDQTMTYLNQTINSNFYNEFILKIDSNSQEIWFRKLFTYNSGIGSFEDKSIKIDSNNNIYFFSHFMANSTVTFPNITITLNSYFGLDGLLLKLNSNGNHVWDRRFYGEEQQKVHSIELQNNELSYLIYLGGTTYLDNLNNQITPVQTTSYSHGKIFKFDLDGTLTNSFNTTRVTNPQYILKDYQGNTVIAGSFNSWGYDFNPNPNQSYIMSSSNLSGFILKLGNCDTSPPIGDSNQYFCSNQNPTISDLTPNSGIIKWYSSSTSTIQLPSSTLLVDGTTYFAEKQTGSCAPSISRLEVTAHINQTPLAPQTTNQVFCESENAKISDLIVNGQNIKWYDSLISSTPLTNNTFLANNTNYYASQTSNNCESDRVVITVTITSINPPTLTSPQTFCFQDNATISNIAITGQNITWYNAQTGGNILPLTTALQNGVTYYATQTINGCESDRTSVLINIQVTDTPIGYLAQTFCSDANSTLNDIVVTGINIIWYDSFVGGSIIPSTTLLQHQTNYYCTQTINGCESFRKPINIYLTNTLNALDYQETICDDLDDGFEIINLTSFNSNLITTTGNTFSYYTSLNGAENQISSAQINNVSNYNLNIGTTTIFVKIDSQNGCHQVVELKLTLVSKPRIAISDIMPICEGTSITINAGNGFDNYNWSTGATTQSTLVSQAGNYSVTVTENHNGISCSSTKNFTVVNSNAATVSEIITLDWTDNNNTITVLISNSSVGDYVYSLDGINYQNSNVFYGLESGEHTVFVKDTNGCGISSEEIYLLMYPKYFTPNGDSYNDTWKIKFSQKEPNFKVAIFDRYGKLLKIMNSYDAWDGKLNGKDLPSDDYWFVVTRQNGKEFRGHFAMKR